MANHYNLFFDFSSGIDIVNSYQILYGKLANYEAKKNKMTEIAIHENDLP